MNYDIMFKPIDTWSGRLRFIPMNWQKNAISTKINLVSNKYVYPLPVYIPIDNTRVKMSLPVSGKAARKECHEQPLSDGR